MLIEIKKNIRGKKLQSLLQFVLKRSNRVSFCCKHDYFCSLDVLENIYEKDRKMVLSQFEEKRKTFKNNYLERQDEFDKQFNSDFLDKINVFFDTGMYKTLENLKQIYDNEAYLAKMEPNEHKYDEIKEILDTSLINQSLSHFSIEIYLHQLLDIFNLKLTEPLKQFYLKQKSLFSMLSSKQNFYQDSTFYFDNDLQMGIMNNSKNAYLFCKTKDYEEFLALNIPHTIGKLYDKE